MITADGGLPFSPAVHAGGLLFVSGQASVDEVGSLVPGTFAQQMRRSVANLERILADAGLGLGHVVKVSAYVHRLGDVPEYNQIYRECFGRPWPARTTLTGCLSDQLLFEVDAVARLPR